MSEKSISNLLREYGELCAVLFIVLFTMIILCVKYPNTIAFYIVLGIVIGIIIDYILFKIWYYLEKRKEVKNEKNEI